MSAARSGATSWASVSGLLEASYSDLAVGASCRTAVAMRGSVGVLDRFCVSVIASYEPMLTGGGERWRGSRYTLVIPATRSAFPLRPRHSRYALVIPAKAGIHVAVYAIDAVHHAGPPPSGVAPPPWP